MERGQIEDSNPRGLQNLGEDGEIRKVPWTTAYSVLEGITPEMISITCKKTFAAATWTLLNASRGFYLGGAEALKEIKDIEKLWRSRGKGKLTSGNHSLEGASGPSVDGPCKGGSESVTVLN